MFKMTDSSCQRWHSLLYQNLFSDKTANILSLFISNLSQSTFFNMLYVPEKQHFHFTASPTRKDDWQHGAVCLGQLAGWRLARLLANGSFLHTMLCTSDSSRLFRNHQKQEMLNPQTSNQLLLENHLSRN